jgi:hypothetical protein
MARVLALILLAGLVATVPLDYASPADLTRIADIYDAVECDDTADIDRDRVIMHAQPVGEPVPTVATDAGLVVGPLIAISVTVAVSIIAVVENRVRPPPHRCDHGRVLSLLSSLNPDGRRFIDNTNGAATPPTATARASKGWLPASSAGPAKAMATCTGLPFPRQHPDHLRQRSRRSILSSAPGVNVAPRLLAHGPWRDSSQTQELERR